MRSTYSNQSGLETWHLHQDRLDTCTHQFPQRQLLVQVPQRAIRRPVIWRILSKHSAEAAVASVMMKLIIGHSLEPHCVGTSGEKLPI